MAHSALGSWGGGSWLFPCLEELQGLLSVPASPPCMFLLVPFAQGIKRYKLSRICNSERRKKNPLGIIHSDFLSLLNDELQDKHLC